MNGGSSVSRDWIEEQLDNAVAEVLNELPGVQMPQGWRASTFVRMAEARGVLVRSADEYALVHGRAPNALRIAIAANLPREGFEAAIRKLADLLARPPADLSV